MKKVFLGIMICFTCLFLLPAQQFIGLNKDMVYAAVKRDLKGFSIDRSSINRTYNYQKYINASGTRTLFVFFDDKDISTHTRLVCDYSELDFILDDFNRLYRKTGENSWEYQIDPDRFDVLLEKKEWYFVVNIKKKVAEKGFKKYFRWKR